MRVDEGSPASIFRVDERIRMKMEEGRLVGRHMEGVGTDLLGRQSCPETFRGPVKAEHLDGDRWLGPARP